MKYSILVLGASISIALFIRICCSLEANMDQMEELFSGRADEVFEKILKISLLHSVNGEQNNNSVNHDHKILEDWIQEIKSIRSNPIPNGNPRASVRRIANTEPITPMNYNYCGNADPPDPPSDCKSRGGCSRKTRSELPDGCDYNETDKGNFMKCSDKTITSIPPLPSELAVLNVSETRIEKISEQDFRNVTIKTIALFRNEIEFIHPWAFGDVNDLQNLLITGNKITYLHRSIYMGLEHATFVDLQYNQISFEMYKNCPLQPIEKITRVLPQLRYLQLSGNPLTIIPKQMFAGLRDSPLISLYLDNTYLREIDEEAFTFLKNLTILNLSKNPSELVYPIKKFARVLQPLTSLKNIYLTDLGFSEIPLEALSHISHQLAILDLSNNKFNMIKHDALSKFPNLQELYLDESSIRVIESNAFTANEKLRVLSLRKNNIQNVPPYFPPNLQYLFLTNIQLDSLNTMPVRFCNLTKLRTLEISAIKIHRITRKTFEGLSALRSIFVMGCGVESIEDGAFQGLTNLEVMTLDENPITEIHSETFTGLDNLETLNMRNCKLSFGSATNSNSSDLNQMEESPFKFLTKVKTLDMTGNNIIHVSASLFQNLSNLCYIRLSNNPFEAWNTRLFPDRVDTVHDQFNPNETCFLTLFLQNGNVQFIKDAMLEDFLRVREIDFSNNIVYCDEGACRFRDLLTSSTTYKQNWLNSNTYKCKDVHSGTLLRILDLSNESCATPSSLPDPVSKPSQPMSSFGSKATLIVIVASLSLVTSVLVMLVYKNRAQLWHFWFTSQFNIMPINPRKVKLSTTEDTSSSYDYDVFISYHHDDSKFIQDVFLPEIERRDVDVLDEAGVVEAKNHVVYRIENDKIGKSNNNNNNSKVKNQNAAKFKVCIHERDFAAGVLITENIVDCVDRSRKTVIFVSKKYMESRWCAHELKYVYLRLVESRRKSFVLVFLEPIPKACRNKILNCLMVSKTYLQWPGEERAQDVERFWRRLRAFLQS